MPAQRSLHNVTCTYNFLVGIQRFLLPQKKTSSLGRLRDIIRLAFHHWTGGLSVQFVYLCASVAGWYAQFSGMVRDWLEPRLRDLEPVPRCGITHPEIRIFCRLRLCLYDISRSLTKVINAKIVIAHVGLDGLSVRHGMTSACFYQVIVASKKSVDEEEGGVQDDDDDDGGYHDNMRLMSVTIYACL